MKTRKNIVMIVSFDRDLLEVRARMFVDTQKETGVFPAIRSYAEEGIEDVLSEASQGVLFSRNEFTWYRDLDSISQSEFEKLVGVLENLTHKNLLITVSEQKKNLERWKVFEKFPHVKIVIYADNDISIYEKILMGAAAKQGFRMSLKAAHALIDRCGGNIRFAYHELLKLILYKFEEKTITEKDVYDFVSSVSEVRTFDFIDSILSKNFEQAAGQLHEIVSSGEKPEAIFYIFLQQFSSFVTVAIDYKAGLKESEIEKETGIKSWQIKKKYVPFSMKWTPDELVNAYWELLKIDMKIKKGTIRDYGYALKLFLLQMISAQKASLQA